jgi:flagellar hook-associated protein 1 FlgK
MSNLLSSLLTSSQALQVFSRSLEVSQNNIANASTPGYAKQTASLTAMPFNPDAGLPGGVRSGPVISSRNRYAEEGVRRQVSNSGDCEQRKVDLASIESAFDVTGESGIPAALNQLLSQFSAWSLAPNNMAARQGVLDGAERLAQAFQQTSTELAQDSNHLDGELRDTVEQINALSSRIRDYNVARQQGNADAGLDAGMYSSLEQLAELTDISVSSREDGSVTVLMGGDTLLVAGEHLYSVDLNFHYPVEPAPVAGTPPLAYVTGSDGQPANVASGRLGALLATRNGVMAVLQGDGQSAGELNRYAKAVADRINDLLTAAHVSQGPPPVPGVPLFTYDPDDGVTAATLQVNPAITPDQLAAIDPGPPSVGNGIALQLAELAHSHVPADTLDGLTYPEFYGHLAALVGRESSEAKHQTTIAAGLAAQARSLRDEISAVSIDEEAVHLMQMQRAYEATARLVSILSDLTNTVIDILK